MNTTIAELQLATKYMHSEVMSNRSKCAELNKQLDQMKMTNSEYQRALDDVRKENSHLYRESAKMRDMIAALSKAPSQGSLASDLQRVSSMRGDADQLFKACLSYSARIGQLEADLEEAGEREKSLEEVQEAVLKEIDTKDNRIRRLETIVSRFKQKEHLGRDELPNGGKTSELEFKRKSAQSNRVSEYLENQEEHDMPELSRIGYQSGVSVSQAEIEKRIKERKRDSPEVVIGTDPVLGASKLLPFKEPHYQPRFQAKNSIFAREPDPLSPRSVVKKDHK